VVEERKKSKDKTSPRTVRVLSSVHIERGFKSFCRVYRKWVKRTAVEQRSYRARVLNEPNPEIYGRVHDNGEPAWNPGHVEFARQVIQRFNSGSWNNKMDRWVISVFTKRMGTANNTDIPSAGAVAMCEDSDQTLGTRFPTNFKSHDGSKEWNTWWHITAEEAIHLFTREVPELFCKHRNKMVLASFFLDKFIKWHVGKECAREIKHRLKLYRIDATKPWTLSNLVMFLDDSVQVYPTDRDLSFGDFTNPVVDANVFWKHAQVVLATSAGEPIKTPGQLKAYTGRVGTEGWLRWHDLKRRMF